MAQSSFTYHVSPNGSAGDWYWEVRSGETIVLRGLAPTDTKARAEAMVAAMSYIDRSAEDLEHPGS
jgi:hypothetical protein